MIFHNKNCLPRPVSRQNVTVLLTLTYEKRYNYSIDD